MSTFQIGTRYDIAPLPHDPTATTMFEAGNVSIGVEYRVVDMEALKQGYGEDAVAAENIDFDNVGVSLHVFSAGDNAEYLRFDCFDNDPHYHYIAPGSHQIVVAYDSAANGDMLRWGLDAIELRLPAMLSFIGADALAATVDGDALGAAVRAAGEMAREAQSRQRVARRQ